MIKHIKSSVFDTGAQIVAHQVNCMGWMNSGVAKQVRTKYPFAYEQYKQYCDANADNRKGMLGKAMFVRCNTGVTIAHLFGQYDAGWNWKYTDYGALENALCTLNKYAYPLHYTVAIPYKMGCDRGGGDWNIVLPMIERCLSEVDVLICELP